MRLLGYAFLGSFVGVITHDWPVWQTLVACALASIAIQLIVGSAVREAATRTDNALQQRPEKSG